VRAIMSTDEPAGPTQAPKPPPTSEADRKPGERRRAVVASKPVEVNPVAVAQAENGACARPAPAHRRRLRQLPQAHPRKEQEDAHARGRESAVKDLLPVFDNLERAAAHAESAADAKVIGDGVRMVIKQFNDALDKMGIKRIVTVGRPLRSLAARGHPAARLAEHPAGVIMAEVQAGYAIGDYLLRAAMVVVSKGAPEARTRGPPRTEPVSETTPAPSAGPTTCMLPGVWER
jgi:molecular chaperone GrpE